MLALGGTTNRDSNEDSVLLGLLRQTCGGAPPHSPQLAGANDHVRYVMPARVVVYGCPNASRIVNVCLQQHRLDDAALLQCGASLKQKIVLSRAAHFDPSGKEQMGRSLTATALCAVAWCSSSTSMESCGVDAAGTSHAGGNSCAGQLVRCACTASDW